MPARSSSNVVLAGDGFAAGSLWRGGWLGLYGRSNSGAKFTYGGPLLASRIVPFYVCPRPEAGLETIMGTVWFRDRKASDLHGLLRYYRKASDSGYYKNGFDETVVLGGSKYTPPSLQELSLNSYPFNGVNTAAVLSGGSFDGLSYLVTFSYKDGWSKSQMKTPKNLNFVSYGNVSHKNGWLWGMLNVSNFGEGTPEIKTYLRGVLLQKQGLISGQAETAGGTVGRYFVAPTK